MSDHYIVLLLPRGDLQRVLNEQAKEGYRLVTLAASREPLEPLYFVAVMALDAFPTEEDGSDE